MGRSLLIVPSVAAAIYDEEGRLLLQEKEGEAWSLPAGAIEPGETPEEAVRREVLEETGLTIDPEKVLGVFGGRDFRYRYPNGDEVEYMIVLYRCRLVEKKEVDISLDQETKSIGYVSKQNMPKLALPYPVALLFRDHPGVIR